MHFRTCLSLESWRPLPIMLDSKNTSRFDKICPYFCDMISQVFIIDYHVWADENQLKGLFSHFFLSNCSFIVDQRPKNIHLNGNDKLGVIWAPLLLYHLCFRAAEPSHRKRGWSQRGRSEAEIDQKAIDLVRGRYWFPCPLPSSR